MEMVQGRKEGQGRKGRYAGGKGQPVSKEGEGTTNQGGVVAWMKAAGEAGVAVHACSASAHPYAAHVRLAPPPRAEWAAVNH